MGSLHIDSKGNLNWNAAPDSESVEYGEYSANSLRAARQSFVERGRRELIQNLFENPERSETHILFEQMRGLMDMRNSIVEAGGESPTIDARIDYLVGEIETRRPGWTIQTDSAYHGEDNMKEYRIPADEGLFNEATVEAIYDTEAQEAFKRLEAEKAEIEFEHVMEESQEYAEENDIDYGYEDEDYEY